MSKRKNSRVSNDGEYKHQLNENSIKKIEESLATIAEALKNDTAKESDNELQKKSIRYTLIGMIIGFLFSIAGAAISIEAINLTRKNAEPYFQLSAIKKNGETSAYHIENTGGRVQSVTIILRDYIDVFDRYYTQDHYYFPCAEVTKTFSGQDRDDYSIDLTDTYFGIEVWTEERGMLSLLKERLDKANLGTYISYFETMEIHYIDAERNVVAEFYAIKEDEHGILKMYLMTSEYREEIKTLIPEGCDFKFRNDDGLCREIGSTGSFGGRRGSDPTAQFCQSVVDKMKEEISRKTIVTFD